MNTKDVILVVAGVAVGYLLVRYLNKSKDSSTTGSTGSTEPTVDQAKVDKCNKEVSDFMATAKFSAGVDLEKKKKEMFDACMAKNA
jgi:uncharacterized membrane-anchored protein YhcB (DUF1043 family)